MKLLTGLHTSENFILSQGYSFVKSKGHGRLVYSHPDYGSIVIRLSENKKGIVLFYSDSMDGSGPNKIK